MTRWLNPQPVDISSLTSMGLNAFVAQTLIRRGFSTPESASAFLNPTLSYSSDPYELPGLSLAMDRLTKAFRNKEHICVWGDFDVDGQTSTAIFMQTLLSLGAKTTYHIPIRAKESHGINLENLKPIIDSGVTLVLTCDTGISASEEVEYARSRDVDFIITDHHNLPDQLPNAFAIINPKLLSMDHPLATLPGAGVSYKASEAVIENFGSVMSRDQNGTSLSPENLTDLAALGIIADLAILKGDTRLIAQTGIRALRSTDRLGLKTLAQLTSLDLSITTEETIAFNLGPRLNALGRLGDANPSIELFLTQDPSRARVIASIIEGLNTQRRLLTDQVYEAAEDKLKNDPTLLTQPVILLAHALWPGGVLGIVASRLVERYHKPVIILTESGDGVLRGSARSVDGLNITEAIATNKRFLLNFGGHPMAAGLSLRQDNLFDFKKALLNTVEKSLGSAILEEATLQIDAWLEFDSLSIDTANALEGLAPFGPGNPALIFASSGLKLRSKTEFGKGREHIKLVVADEHEELKEILWWNGATEDSKEALTTDGIKFDLAYRLRANNYRGERQLALEFVDYRITDQKLIEVSKPALEIHDLRLHSIRSNLSNSTLIFAEGKEKINGNNRYDLFQADELAIWTTPPSPAELKIILDIVKPRIIYLIAVNPPDERINEFLKHLAGLIKFAINHNNGKSKLSELAASTAQREATVKFGIEYLAVKGQIVFEITNDEYEFKYGNDMINPYLVSEIFAIVKGLLEETSAYRVHFAHAEPDSLFNF